MLLNFDSVSMGANTYVANARVALLEELSDNKTNLCKGITALNIDQNTAVVVTLYLGDAVLISQTLNPREYITFNTWVVVNKKNALRFQVDNTNIDFTIPMIIKANKVEL